MLHATTIVGDTVWLYGGTQNGRIKPVFDDLYQLDLHTLTWSIIHTGKTKPPGCWQCNSFNALSDGRLVLHGGRIAHNNKDTMDDAWILALPSCTWTRYKANPRVKHTGSTGLNKEVILTGGLNPDLPTASGHYKLHKYVCHIMLEPKLLQQFAMKAVFVHQYELPWKERLPRTLIELMDVEL